MHIPGTTGRWFMDYASRLEVYRLWEGDFMKNKMYLAKTVFCSLAWMYASAICMNAMRVLMEIQDFSTISFAVFIFIANFFCIKNCTKNINTYTFNKLLEEKDD